VLLKKLKDPAFIVLDPGQNPLLLRNRKGARLGIVIKSLLLTLCSQALRTILNSLRHNILRIRLTLSIRIGLINYKNTRRNLLL
jgi:hypothetical protein